MVEQEEEDEEHAEQEAEVSHAVGDEGLVPGVRLGDIREPEADQQVRAEADAFPAHEHEGERGAEHEDEHREHEEVQVREVAAEAPVMAHVAHRVEVDQRSDARDHEDHHGRERIQQEGDVDLQGADVDPREDGLGERPLGLGQGPKLEEEDAAYQERGERTGDGECRDESLGRALAFMGEEEGHEPDQRCGEQREERDQTDQWRGVFHGAVYSFISLKSSTFNDSLFLNRRITMARPIAASAAATAITRKV
ncbi:hypothetical protein D3C87_1159590 [compost metagenome]